MIRAALGMTVFVIGMLSSQTQSHEVRMWLPEVTSEFPNVRDMAISPDGMEYYFTVESVRKEFSAIVMVQFVNARWSEPNIVPFSGQYRDLEPAFSYDGKRLYFVSNRPYGDTSQAPKDYDIWYVERDHAGGEWSEPVNLGRPVNTPKGEYYPSLTKAGDLYFTREADDPARKEDIFVSRLRDKAFSEPTPLSDAVNSEKYEFNAFIAPDESYILFTSYARSDDLGGGDLYISWKREGEWMPAVHLGSDVNSNRIDYCPTVDTKRHLLYFTSERSSVPRWFPSSRTLPSLLDAFRKGSIGNGRIYTIPFNPSAPE